MARVPSRHSIAKTIRVVGVVFGIGIVWFALALMMRFLYGMSWPEAMTCVTFVLAGAAASIGAVAVIVKLAYAANERLRAWERSQD